MNEQDYERIKGLWNAAVDAIKPHCDIKLGECYVQHGIPQVVQKLEKALAEVERLKVETEQTYCAYCGERWRNGEYP